jgi:methyltransferase (TIGR00027 family)
MGLCAISPPLRNFAERRLDRRFPGVPADFICRTRYIDSLLAESVGAGDLERLVMLGAGYDTRGLRSRAPHLAVIEIDHPATQKRKIRIATGVFDRDTLARTTFVAHDLATPPDESAALRDALGRARTFWIAEGVLSYLPPRAISRLFSWIARKSTAGSRIVFDYAHRDFVEGRADSPASKAIFDYVKRAGEPFASGWTPDEIARECRNNGILLEDDVSEEELAARYLTPLGRRLTTVEEFRIASGRIATASA